VNWGSFAIGFAAASCLWAAIGWLVQHNGASMRVMSGLALFRRTSNSGCWNLASFHSPHSLTWSWILSFSLPQGDSGRWLGFHRWQTNQGQQWLLQIARCDLQWRRQRPIWYRHLYQKQRDEIDGLKEARVANFGDLLKEASRKVMQ